MKGRRLGFRLGGFAWAVWLCWFGSQALAEPRFIRLRNELIVTSPPAQAAARPQAVEAPVSGLYLVQFNDRFQSPWKAQLESVGVTLLRYVPDDAFVVRVQHGRLSQLRALACVRWVGEYQTKHKVHPALRALPGGGTSALSPRVSLLLSPQAAAGEVMAVRQLFGSIQRVSRSRLGLILQGTLKAGNLEAAARSEVVLWMEPAPQFKLFDEVATKIVGGPNPGSHPSATQALGFTGKGVVVSVADSGLNNGDAETMHPDLAGRVDSFLWYGELENAADEHSHGTHVAGIVAGDGATGETDENGFLYGLGVAPEARIVVQRIFDGEGKHHPPPSNEALTRDAVRAGAVIGSNSWGDDTQGRYDLSAAEFDALVRDADAQTPGEQPYVLEFSAGNAGPAAQTVGSPAVAKNVIATGASQSDRPDLFIYTDGIDAMADFSSRGLCEDGRLKPDLVAPGTWIASLQSASATDLYAWMPVDEYYQFQGGTSSAGPHVSGAAAVFVQYYRDTHGGTTPSPALVKAALINSADDMNDAEGGTEPVPNLDEGWGRVNLANLIGSDRKSEFVDQTVLLTNRQSFERRFLVGSRDLPLKVTLAYTDVPGFPAALPALVNDLDLEVVGPDGRVYGGNQFDRGESIPGSATADRLNNLEAVHLFSPEPGEYSVRVRAHNVVEDIHRQTNLAPRQDFALVISGDLPLPGVGVLLCDRGAYRAPDLISLRLIDFDLAGVPSVAIRATSRAELAGELITLMAFGKAGVFTGAVAAVLGPAAADGRLQVHADDELEFVYQDASPQAARTAEAVIDLAPPVISAVSGALRFSRVVASWETDEPATSLVRYGTSPNTTLAASGGGLTTHHEITLAGLSPGQTCYFLVVSADEAGNLATNDNAGQLFRVQVPPAPPVLIVDAYQDLLGFFDIPITTYTDALDLVGIGYDTWDVASAGRAPNLEEIRPYRVVMWRVAELTASLTTADIKTLRDYVQAGGGLFMASMEVLSRLDESGFANFRRNVLHVESYEVDPGVPAIYGVNNLSLSSGVDMGLDYSAYPDLIIIPPDLADTFEPSTNAAPIFFESSTGRPAGLCYPRTGEAAPGRVIFFSFPLDTIPLDGAEPNNRVAVVRNIVSFLAPGILGLGMVELDRAEYTLPARAAVQVADSDLAGQGGADVSLFIEGRPNGEPLRLNETTQAGLFLGWITLIAETNAPPPGQFPLRDGQSFRVEYYDASARLSLQAAARADISVPTISGVAAAPDYSEATVNWLTSEPADALVQFGESTFLGRTAYVSELTEEHQVTLTGLLPNRDYYFQVTSRDAAGNTVVDDNQGRFHVLRTLKPLAPPFVDDLERGAANWSVVDDELDAETSSILQSSSWELGRPQNELAAQAHSGQNAWGTNLRGESNDYANSSLVSPAIELTGGNAATLRFWHTYDFTPRSVEGDILEMGEVYVTTNNGALWIPLMEFSEASAGWELVEIDLTPYVGRVVRLGWAYALFSIDAVVHPGWLVDDLSVTMSNVERGTIIVTNNLAQAVFSLGGPLERTGRGFGLVLTNAPAGRYVIHYEPVPFYATPLPQTNLLSGVNTVVFQGYYSYGDLNQNGLSDTWEQTYFGGAWPSHPADLDSDGDGASDYAEFMAGTNPTNAADCLLLSPPVFLPNRTVQLAWPSAVGHAYRLELATNLVEWLPATGWLLATNANSAVVLPPLTGSRAYQFRLEVKP